MFPAADWHFEDILFVGGFNLDFGGIGGEVIGKLMAEEVLGIIFKEEELWEAAQGPLKINMDARDL